MKKLLNYFKRGKKTSANLAKERLQIIISHERMKEQGTDFLANIKKELLDVIAKHCKVDADSIKEQVNVDLEQKEGHSVLEFNITLPDFDPSKAEPAGA